MFSDSQALVNSVDPDQTAPAVWPGSTFFAIPSASLGHITLSLNHIAQSLGYLQHFFGCLNF